jgi:hypothetical protein
MRYMLLIYGSEAAAAKASPADDAAMFKEYDVFTKELTARGTMKGGEALQPTGTATTVRVRNGKHATTDGPFAETKEQLGGYYIVDVKNLDEAIGAASMIPGAKVGSIEIRPIMELGA